MHVVARRKRFAPARHSVLRVLACGCLSHREFAEPLRLVRETAAFANCDTAEALLGRAVNSPDRYDLLLVCPSRPGVLPSDLGTKLQRYAPLVGRVHLLGSWYEGEERTGQPWEDTERVFWHRFDWWWRANLEQFARGGPPSWIRAGEPNRIKLKPGSVLVCAADGASTESITAIVRQAGADAIGIRSGERLPLVTHLHSAVWVGSQLVGEERDRLADFATAMHRRGVDSVVAVVDFPRYETVMWARSLGVHVVGKPYRNEELLAALATPVAIIRSTLTPNCA